MAATSVRFIVAPIIFGVMLTGWPHAPWLAAALFVLGSLTDWLDGYWARIFDAHTVIGKFMDPIADKILVLSVLIILIHFQRIGPVAPAILLARDIFIGGVRSIAAADNVIIAAKPTGKWKTAIQMVAIPCLFVDHEAYGLNLYQIGVVGLWISVVLSVISGAEYTLGYFRGAKGARHL
jgi:CDP-diacylglycerol--glycerol-3-phosphate 3-phosphatidyltransferase